MLFTYINEVDRSGDVKAGSVLYDSQLKQRADSCKFQIFQNGEPSENEDIRIFKGDTIASAAGATITLNGFFTKKISLFYPGQKLYIRIGDSDEEVVEVLTYVESTLTIVLVAAPSGSVSAGDKIGDLVFGGVASRVKNKNIAVLQNLEYEIVGVGYSKIFDKKLIADTWEDRDSRYIINDFCNTTINFNRLIDDFEYANDGAIQAEWLETGDGDNPVVDTTKTNYREGSKSGKFAWTNAGGTATFTSSPDSFDISEFTGVSSGTPTKGVLAFWDKPDDNTKLSSFDIRIGSGSGDYASFTITPDSDDFVFRDLLLKNASITGTPDWTAITYCAIVVAETASSHIFIDGIRILTEQFFNHYPNVKETPEFDDIRSPQLKPTGFINTLAKSWNYNWYIDYDRSIYFFDREDKPAPFDLTSTSDNFQKLKIEVDQSQLGNRIIVRGGDKNSDNAFAEVEPGNNARRVWKLKSKFSSLTILIDDNGTTNAAEVGTNTTNIKVTGHGLATGDHVINRTRANAVREITKVDNDNYTVEAVASQTDSDTISEFAVTGKTIGIEGLVDESTVDYVSNFNEKTVRATDSEATLDATDFIRFRYFEKVPIEIQYSDPASVGAMKALNFGDGIFDMDPYTDRNIEDIGSALAIAQAQVREYSNPVMRGVFETDKHGLRAGQIIGIEDSVRSIDTQYVIQIVKAQQIESRYSDYFVYQVKFGTTLFGIIEFFQKLLAIQEKVELNVDEIVSTYISSDEIVEASEASVAAKDGGFKTASEAETVECSEANTVVKIADWKFEPSGQGIESRFDLASFS